MSSNLVIVYHRQPYEEVEVDGRIEYRENKSPNGIVPTLKSFFGRFEKGAWVAWKQAEDPAHPDFERVIEIDDQYGKYTVSRLPLTAEQITSFYHVSSKEAFWPILHGFKERYNYDPVDWPTFREVNWAFAEAAAAEAADGAVVWIHDYNLWLVPGYLRKLRPDVKISFFHHTPFPGADMFNVLPWRSEILESLLACDVVGFHIPRYVNNFVSAARSLLEVDTKTREKVKPELASQTSALSEQSVPTQITFDGRTINLQASPVGVDVDYIEQLVAREETAAKVKQIKQELGDAQLILSVGRTDYTKGGIEQLHSYERLLETRPDLRGKLRLMHVSVAANSNMVAYEEIQSELEHIAGRINGRFGSLDWQPLALLSRAVPFEQLVAYYRAADVAWITPLADGMNLVCKEYGAARADGDGVLVLSEFAGAAVELYSAVITNPFSHKSMDSAISLALEMPEQERRERMKLMREIIRKQDVRFWAEDQMQAFDSADLPKTMIVPAA
ncbi:MAG: glucosylglycerol-phosphate synthase [Confluentimicrobium sp.]|jgi:glucosylglycerol-phosphate synthase|uniref:glucosylglycerol-phosphate synthase n=1 Tax=Actibacterium sp. TaxID=1872125 RepID=UPI00050DB8FD|nr:glucosylglycerol-phosphate synthase [Actibacterium sp.]KGB81640.1 glucosylglycerol-phosphate synthase [Rhodovulum sp. NI22]MBC56482.1 glucosylglycerol-phosphate synthase [Actibacterium sp.]MDY6857730.1 glucosylglycerol-phosphate synthase [Pseudomonadota bacterium]|tara:strand:+ start:283 stop:1788 length:1506 start_codon:yes stop_codon:yes gene_type:complete